MERPSEVSDCYMMSHALSPECETQDVQVSNPSSPGLIEQDVQVSNDVNPSSPGLTDQDVETLPVSVKPSSSSLQNSCNVCNKTFSQKFMLNRHVKSHLKKKPFCCDLCEKSFVQKTDLLKHQKVHLKTPVIYKCDECNEVFSKKRDLFQHKKIHKAPKEYKCDECDEVFSKKRDFLKHQKKHQFLKMYTCDVCTASFPKKREVLEHMVVHQEFKCDECDEVFSKKRELLHHNKFHKAHKRFKCDECGEFFKRKWDLLRHVNTTHSTEPKSPSLKEILFEKVKHFQRFDALGVFTKTMIYSNEENDKDFYTFFDGVRPDVSNELHYQMEEKKAIKWYATVQALVSRVTNEGDTETATPFFHSRTVLAMSNNQLPLQMEEAFAKMMNSYEKFTARGSNWTLEKILNIELSTALFSIV